MKINEMLVFVNDRQKERHVFFNENGSCCLVLDERLNCIDYYDELEESPMYSIDEFMLDVLQNKIESVYEFIFIDEDVKEYILDLVEENDFRYKQRLIMQLK